MKRYARLMRDLLRLSAIAAIVGTLGLLLGACGSGGQDERQAQSADETVRSERQYRQASVLQQQDAEQPAQMNQADQVEVEQEIAIPSEIDFGHREGLPFTRNIVGDPEAPVLVIEYSDFQ